MAFFYDTKDVALFGSPLPAINLDESSITLNEDAVLQLLMEPFLPSLDAYGMSPVSNTHSQASSVSDLDLLLSVTTSPIVNGQSSSPSLSYVCSYPSPTPALIHSLVPLFWASAPQVPHKPNFDSVINHPLLLPLSATIEPGMDDILEAMKTPTPLNLLFKRSQAKNEHTTKPMRFRPTDGEYALLTGIFNKNQFPSRALREKLAAHLGLNMRQVQLWFQNRRASLKSAGISLERPRRSHDPVSTNA